MVGLYAWNTVFSPQTWDNNLEVWASAQADNMATTCSMQHTTSSARQNIPGWVGKQAGENLAFGADSKWDTAQVATLVTMANQGKLLQSRKVRGPWIVTTFCYHLSERSRLSRGTKERKIWNLCAVAQNFEERKINRLTHVNTSFYSEQNIKKKSSYIPTSVT